jgi:hypothetical protein
MCRSNLLPLLAGVLLLVSTGCDVVRKPTPPPPAPVERVPLWQAAARGDLNLVQARVGEGADVTTADAEGLTALHYAARQGRVDILRYLLLQQAPLDVRDHRAATPLHLAAREGQLEAVQALVEAGADVLARDQETYTPHDLAALLHHQPVMDFLAAHGGAPVVEDVAVATPADADRGQLPGVDQLVRRATGGGIHAPIFDTVVLRKSRRVLRAHPAGPAEAGRPDAGPPAGRQRAAAR